MEEARALYASSLGNMRALARRGPPRLAGRKIGVLGVLWPSKRFADDGADPGRRARAWAAPATPPTLRAQLDELKGDLRRRRRATRCSSRPRQLVPELEDEPAGASAVRRSAALGACSRPRPPTDDASDTFFELPGDEVLRAARGAGPARRRRRPEAAARRHRAAPGTGAARHERRRRRHRRLLQRLKARRARGSSTTPPTTR